MLVGEHYLNPQEDAEIPWWDVQDVIGQSAAAGTLRLPIIPLALVNRVGIEHTIIPLLGTREVHIWAPKRSQVYFLTSGG